MKPHNHFHKHGASCGCNCCDTHEHGDFCHGHSHSGSISKKEWIPVTLSGLFFALALILDGTRPTISACLHIIAYLTVGLPVWKHAYNSLRHGDFFNEFVLMGVATVGAVALGEYAEAVAVMLFYTLGEMLQERAVRQARGHIGALLDSKEQKVMVLRNGKWETDVAEHLALHETVRLQAGNMVPVDGILRSEKGRFNTAALTGESMPQSKHYGETVLAGMINEEHVVEMEVSKLYQDSARARIIKQVEEARSRKSPTELMIRKFARIYTPAVFFLALVIAVIPPMIVEDSDWNQWIYRALVFLVISCPCALVISVPLAYFSGIGAASRMGILFKGAGFLDRMARLKTLVFDKTGTLTKGNFTVCRIGLTENAPKNMIAMLCSLETYSTHPIARAITAYGKTNQIPFLITKDVQEIAGKGLCGIVDGHLVKAGNRQIISNQNIYTDIPDNQTGTAVYMTCDGQYAGWILLGDEIKEEARQVLQEMKNTGIDMVMLSGDKQDTAEIMGRQLGITRIHGNLMPEDKVKILEDIMKTSHHDIAYVGDGINDTPALALSTIGIAMGQNGSEAAIETADVILQSDNLKGLLTARHISRNTRRIVIENIIMALSIKAIVLILGALGIANMWEAVFADVGVALLAVLNSVRLLHMKH